MKNQIQLANRNIRLYVLIKVFAKRVFLPLAAIYFVQVDHFTIRQIGLLAAMFAFVQLFAELPTGYFADRFARVTSIRVGAALNIAATLMYVFVHQKAGVFAGEAMEALGYSFMSGAGEALIYDSLVVKKQEHSYSKIVSRAQSVSLLINAGLLALVPLTYRIDPRLPFAIGTIAYASLLLVASSMQDVGRQKAAAFIRPKLSLSLLTKNHHIIAFGLLFGIVSALYTGPSDVYNLTLKSIGIPPDLLGLLFASASLLGAAIGPFIHQLKRLGWRGYMIFDGLLALIPMFVAYTRIAWLLAVVWVLNMSFWRYRRIIYQEYLLTIYPTNYKASLLSAMSFTEEIALLWMPVVITTVVAGTSLSQGLGITGIAGLCVLPLYLIAARRLLPTSSK
jgi:MFS family permease